MATSWGALNEFGERLLADGSILGSIASVVYRGSIIYSKVDGHADLERTRPLALNAIFNTASMTKPIISVAILKLIEMEMLAINDPITKYIPSFESTKVAYKDPLTGALSTVQTERPISILDLAIHCSGLASHHSPAKELYERAMASLRPDHSLADWVDTISRVPLSFQPGAKWEYARGADILGRIIEVVTGRDLSVFLEDTIFKPLGMVDTAFSVPQAKAHRLVPAHKYLPGLGLKPTRPFNPNPRFLSGASGLYSTVTDYLCFTCMLGNEGRHCGQGFLTPISISHMQKCYVASLPLRFLRKHYFGLGVAVDSDSRSINYGAYGWGGLNTSYFLVNPYKELMTILVLFTEQNAEEIFHLAQTFNRLVALTVF